MRLPMRRGCVWATSTLCASNPADIVRDQLFRHLGLELGLRETFEYSRAREVRKRDELVDQGDGDECVVVHRASKLPHNGKDLREVREVSECWSWLVSGCRDRGDIDVS